MSRVMRGARNCPSCGREVVRLAVAWGGSAAFEPDDWPTDEVPDKARYAFNKFRGAVVDLSSMPTRALPRTCLMMHFCDQLAPAQSVGESLAHRPDWAR